MLLIGTVMLGIAVLMAGYTLRLLFILVSTSRWMCVPAQLVKVDIRHRKLRDRSLRGEELIREIPLAIRVEYEYESAGQRIRGRALNLMDLVIWGFNIDRRDIEELRGIGKQVDVWVDPKKPARSVMRRRVPLNGLVSLVLVLCMSTTIALVTAEAVIDTFGSVTSTAVVVVAVAGILHAIALGIGRLMNRRS